MALPRSSLASSQDVTAPARRFEIITGMAGHRTGSIRFEDKELIALTSGQDPAQVSPLCSGVAFCPEERGYWPEPIPLPASSCYASQGLLASSVLASALPGCFAALPPLLSRFRPVRATLLRGFLPTLLLPGFLPALLLPGFLATLLLPGFLPTLLTRLNPASLG